MKEYKLIYSQPTWNRQLQKNEDINYFYASSHGLWKAKHRGREAVFNNPESCVRWAYGVHGWTGKYAYVVVDHLIEKADSMKEG